MKRLGCYFLLCLIIWSAPGGLRAQTPTDVETRRARLQAELEAEERAIAVQTQLLQAKQRETATVKGELDLLKSQIAQAQARIKAKRVAIQGLDSEILEREDKIDILTTRINREQESLAELLRKTHEVDSLSVVEVVLTGADLSNFFRDVDSFELVQKSLHRSFAAIRGAQEQAAAEKEALEGKKNQELDAKKEIEAEQKRIAKRETEKQLLLTVNKNQEQAYRNLLTARQKRAAEIRSALFALRDSAAIPFGRALEYAVLAQSKTGVRPAFLLAILQQESNLGENVGTCNRPGDPPSKSWRNIMKPSRDHAPYLRITGALGLDPDSMPLSCPWQGGWGGAMGPAQFIPSTWDLYRDKIAGFLGLTAPNPWEPRDAFMASSIYLAELGAKRGTYSAEREAALRYYAGSNWAKPQNAFYGNEVMARAQDIQLNMIEPLQNI